MHGEAERLSRALDELDDRVTWDADRMLVEAIELEHRARDLGEELLIVRAELTQANLRMRGGDLATAAQQVPKIFQRASGLNSTALLARTHLLWATLYRHLGDAPNCLEHSVLSVTRLDDTATEHMQIWYRAKLGDALALNGSLAEARACFGKAVELATQMGRPMLAITVLNNQAYAECAAGRPDQAREVVARLRELAGQHGFELTAPLLDTIATVEIEGGEYARAESTLLTALEKHAVDPQDDADAMPEYLLTLARAQRGLGAYARAQQNLDVCRDLCVTGSLGQVLVKVHQEQARLQAARGDFAEAFATHETFFEAYVEMRSLQDEARARTRHAMLETAQVQQDADRFREQARRDPLTGLRNRRYVDERLGELIGSGGDLVVALADLDYFKRVNDLFSHDTGDQVLIQVSRLLQAEIQPVGGSFAARLGGEEFLLVLPGVRPEPAAQLLESMRRAVDRHPWNTIAAGLNVTISLGAAWCSGAEPPTTQRNLLSTADQHLYAAKHSGRNRVRHDLPRPRRAGQ